MAPGGQTCLVFQKKVETHIMNSFWILNSGNTFKH